MSDQVSELKKSIIREVWRIESIINDANGPRSYMYDVSTVDTMLDDHRAKIAHFYKELAELGADVDKIKAEINEKFKKG